MSKCIKCHTRPASHNFRLCWSCAQHGVPRRGDTTRWRSHNLDDLELSQREQQQAASIFPGWVQDFLDIAEGRSL